MIKNIKTRDSFLISQELSTMIKTICSAKEIESLSARFQNVENKYIPGSMAKEALTDSLLNISSGTEILRNISKESLSSKMCLAKEKPGTPLTQGLARSFSVELSTWSQLAADAQVYIFPGNDKVDTKLIVQIDILDRHSAGRNRPPTINLSNSFDPKSLRDIFVELVSKKGITYQEDKRFMRSSYVSCGQILLEYGETESPYARFHTPVGVLTKELKGLAATNFKTCLKRIESMSTTRPCSELLSVFGVNIPPLRGKDIDMCSPETTAKMVVSIMSKNGNSHEER